MSKIHFLLVILLCLPLMGGVCDSKKKAGALGATTAPGAFTLVSPNDKTGAATTAKLTWTNAADETGYRIEIASDSAFANLVHFTTVGADVTTYTVPVSSLQANITYYWRIKAQNNIGETIATTTPPTTPPTPAVYSFVTVGDKTAVGVLDVNFNASGSTPGINTHDGAAAAAGKQANDVANAVLIDGSGRILVAGYSSNGTDMDMTVWRYLSDGTLDTTGFNSPNGFVTSGTGGVGLVGNDRAYGITMDGLNILVVGYVSNGQNKDMAIWKFTDTGVIDVSFNTNGFVSDNGAAAGTGGKGDDIGYAIGVDSSPGKKVIVAGTSQNSSSSRDQDMVVWRYLSSGSVDSTFNGTYFNVWDSAGGDDQGRDFAFDTNGDIIVSGSSTFLTTMSDMSVWKVDAATGFLDTAFGTNGRFDHDGAAGSTNSDDQGRGIVIENSGKIIVTGYSAVSGTNKDMAIWRLTSAGALDTTFSTDGYDTHNSAALGNAHDEGYGVIVDLDGRYVVAGYSVNPNNNPDMALWRYNTNGTLDTPVFNNPNGFVIHNNAGGGNKNDMAYALTIDSQGRLVVVGQSDNGSASVNADMTIWRWK